MYGSILYGFVLSLESASRTFRSLFEGKHQMLQEKIDTEYGLLNELEACKVITSQHRTAVEAMFATVTDYCIVQSKSVIIKQRSRLVLDQVRHF